MDEEGTSQASDTLWKEEICPDILQYTALYAWYITVLIKDVMWRDVSCYTDLAIVHDADLTQSIYTSEVHLYYNIVPVRFLQHQVEFAQYSQFSLLSFFFARTVLVWSMRSSQLSYATYAVLLRSSNTRFTYINIIYMQPLRVLSV